MLTGILETICFWNSYLKYILWIFFFLYWLFLLSNQVTILHMPWQLSCHGMWKISPDMDIISHTRATYHSWFRSSFISQEIVCEIGPRSLISYSYNLSLNIWFIAFVFRKYMRSVYLEKCSHKMVYKQRVLMHRHQGWNVRHGLCHIYMRYIYIYMSCL